MSPLAHEISEAEKRALNEAAIVSEIDLEGHITYVNDQFVEISQYSREELIGQEYQISYSKKNSKTLLEDLWKTINKGKEWKGEIQNQAKDDSLYWTNATIAPIFDGKGKLIQYISVQCDITDRKRIEEVLATEKEWLSVTLRSMGEGVITADLEGKIILMNKVAENLTGWTLEEAKDKLIGEVFCLENQDSTQFFENLIKKVSETERAINWESESTLISKNGQKRSISNNYATVRDKDSNTVGIVAIFRDVMEKKRVEEELSKASKLESMGIFSGGIAHDFNNFLTVILGNLSMIKEQIGEKEDVAELLAEVEKATIRAKDLTQQLLVFSKGGTALVKKVTSVSKLVQEVAHFSLSGSNVRCEFSLGDNLWPVEIDIGQINQVINNLIINAQQAMSMGGVIQVNTKNVTMGIDETDEALLYECQKEKYVKISIQDHGAGISKDNLDKIFDPFFTTKTKGNGLGLATCYSIIKKHDGIIKAISEPGSGTLFNIYLPAVEKNVEQESDEKEPMKLGKGNILIMDDEEMVRDVSGRILSRLGYKVQGAIDGVQAIEFYQKAQEKGAPFDVVILDITIPGGMGGQETMKKILEIDPNARGIISSGYSNDPVISEFKKYGFGMFMIKPYKMEELGKAVQKVLQKK